MGVKLAIAISLFVFMPAYWMAALTIIVLAVVYRHIIALFTGLNVVDVNDLNCFYTNKEATCNIISCTPVSVGNVHLAPEAFEKLTRFHLKMRCGIVKVLGDMYYKELDVKEVIKTQVVILPDGYLET